MYFKWCSSGVFCFLSMTLLYGFYVTSYLHLKYFRMSDQQNQNFVFKRIPPKYAVAYYDQVADQMVEYDDFDVGNGSGDEGSGDGNDSSDDGSGDGNDSSDDGNGGENDSSDDGNGGENDSSNGGNSDKNDSSDGGNGDENDSDDNDKNDGDGSGGDGNGNNEDDDVSDDSDDKDEVQTFQIAGNASNGAAPPRGPKREVGGRVRYPWPLDPECKHYDIAFAISLPRSFLVSYPRSGNSWVRYLIEGASGIFTGSKYNSKTMEKKGFLGETVSFRSKRTIIIKIHKNSRKKVHDYSKAVLLIRNPAKSIVSYWNYNKARKKGQRAQYNVSSKSYQTQEFHNFVRSSISVWEKLALDRLRYSRKLLVVPYEYVKEDAIAQIRRILKFLNVPADEGRLKCISKHLVGRALGLQRKIDPFTLEERQMMAKKVANVQSFMNKRGLGPLPRYPELEV